MGELFRRLSFQPMVRGEYRLFEVATVEIEQLCRDRQTREDRTIVEANARDSFVCVNEGEKTVMTKSVVWRMEEEEKARRTIDGGWRKMRRLEEMGQCFCLEY